MIKKAPWPGALFAVIVPWSIVTILLQELTATIVPDLKARYMLSVGSAEIELVQLRIATTKLKRTIELIQAALNRGEKPDISRIEEQLDAEMVERRMEVLRKKLALKEAQSSMKMCRMSREEAAAFKSLYRSLVMKLHPDVNPGQTAREKGLWLRLQSACTHGDKEDMKLVAVLLTDCTQPDELSCLSGIDEWSHRKVLLEGALTKTRAEITKVKSEFPFSIRDRISDDRWTEEQNRKTMLLIQQEIDLKKSLEAYFDAMGRMLHL
ncbi:MAG: hypothetical protein AB2L14_03550 [Candidatus Xenobiia bacterium LiM19]